MADVQFDISLKNNGSGTEGLTIFAPVMATSQKANKYAFSTPYAATYPTGTVFTILDDNGSSIVTLSSEITMAQVILLLNALNIGTFILAYNDSINGNVFHLLSVRNPQTFSIDNGNIYYVGTFTNVDTSGDYSSEKMLIKIIDSLNVLMANSFTSVRKSTDGGATYIDVALPGATATTAILYLGFSGGNVRGWVLAFDAGVNTSYTYRTNTTGSSWALMGTFLNYHMLAMVMLTLTDGFIIGINPSAQYYIYQTNDQGVSISQIQTITPASDYQIRFPIANAGFIFCLDAANFEVWRTTDTGATWLTTTLPARAYYGFSLDANNVYVGSDNGIIYYSSDGGVTFNPISTGATTPVRCIYAFDTNYIIISTDPYTIKRTFDGGITWTTETITGGGSGAFVSFMFDGLNQNFGIGNDNFNIAYTIT